MTKGRIFDAQCPSCFWDKRTTDQWSTLYTGSEKIDHCHACCDDDLPIDNGNKPEGWESQATSPLKRAILKIRKEKENEN